MTLPTTLNGFPVIGAMPYYRENDPPQALWVILVDRGEDEPGPRYVTAKWWPSLGTVWHAGDYVDELERARATMVDRCAHIQAAVAAF